MDKVSLSFPSKASWASAFCWNNKSSCSRETFIFKHVQRLEGLNHPTVAVIRWKRPLSHTPVSSYSSSSPLSRSICRKQQILIPPVHGHEKLVVGPNCRLWKTFILSSVHIETCKLEHWCSGRWLSTQKGTLGWVSLISSWFDFNVLMMCGDFLLLKKSYFSLSKFHWMTLVLKNCERKFSHTMFITWV